MISTSVQKVLASFFNSRVSSGIFPSSTFGHEDSGCHKNSGPRSQRWLRISSDGFIPLDASSAGFNIPGTCFHSSGREFSLISLTLVGDERLETMCFIL